MAFVSLTEGLGKTLAPLYNTPQLDVLVQAAQIERDKAIGTLTTAVDIEQIRRLQGEVQTLDNLIDLPNRLKAMKNPPGR